MDAARYLAIARRWWWLLIVGSLIAVATFGVVSRVRDHGGTTTAYAASASLFVSDPQWVSGGTSAAATASDRLLTSYVAMITGPDVAARLVEQLGLPASSSVVRQHISATVPTGSQVIEITTTGATPAEAEVLSRGVIQAFLALHDQGRLPGSATLIAATPASPVPPTTRPEWQTVLLVAMFGLLSAASIVVIFEYLTDIVRDAADAQVAGVPVLAGVPTWSPGRGARFATSIQGRGAAQASEGFRMLRTAIGMAGHDQPVRRLLFTAAHRRAGTTTAAANYAYALAQTGRSVAIVDANMREPAQHRMFGAEATPGLAEALAVPDVSLERIVQTTPINGVAFVAAGLCPANPTELLDSPRFDELLDGLGRRFDAVVVDGPPSIGTADATLLAQRCDAAILVVRGDHTSRAKAVAAIAALQRTPARVLGAFLNGGSGALWPAPLRGSSRARRPEAGVR